MAFLTDKFKFKKEKYYDFYINYDLYHPQHTIVTKKLNSLNIN